MKNFNSLGLREKIGFLSLFALIFTQTACLPMMRFGKRLENSKHSQSAPAGSNKEYAAEFSSKSAAGVAEKEIYQFLMAGDLKTIEKIADEARSKKERLEGGYWKIDAVYEAVAKIYAEYPGQQVTDEMWRNRIEFLKQWKADSPESITARVALAIAYINYGWAARGTGYINTVSRENFKLFVERLDQAEEELFQAGQLDARCPRWYREVLFLGMARGVSDQEFDEVYQEAVKFEPNYLQFHLVKSENLTPKWGGAPGDWQKFVDSLPGKLATLKTDETDIIYFVTVVNKLSDSSLGINWAMISKERIQKGFADMERKYGVDNVRLNQYAFISALTMDFPAAKKAFERIGSDWNSRVWGEQTFNQMKKIVEQGIPGAPK